jgi:hypothetical protein
MIRGKKGQQLLASMPRDRVLTETDGPFGNGDDGPLLPGQVGPAIAACGKTWLVDVKDAQAQLDLNLKHKNVMHNIKVMQCAPQTTPVSRTLIEFAGLMDVRIE